MDDKPHYQMASQGSSEFGHERAESKDDDAAIMLSQAAPTAHYEDFDPRIYGLRHFATPHCNPIYTPTHSIPTYTASNQSPPSSPGFRSRLVSNREGTTTLYHEPVAWANSTHFREAKDTTETPTPAYETHTLTTIASNAPQKQCFRTARHLRQPWKPGAWPRFPWKGLVSLLMTATLTAASVIILFSADGTTVDEWAIGDGSVQPAVYVSVFEMGMNLLVLCGFAEGVVVTFWRRVLNGSTIAGMHDMYESAYVLQALRSTIRLQFNSIATACLMAVLSTIRGPLFQRSLTMENGATTYQTNPTFVALGVVISLGGIIAILPLYYSYWELGRSVSLNPLEIARAFGAPLLDGMDGNASANDVQIERGSIAVRFGVVERLGDGKLLRIEDSRSFSVRMPWEEELFR